ncbi:methyltransferase domain-containing protein [Streptomyces massasporeus]|uniref:class I SAM-dependent methyltransferase n=1 Tax=Streptomyces massasporeus TaxID=67324 RepID=UPI0033EBD41F
MTNYQDTAYVERYGHHDGEVTRREVAFLIEHANIEPGDSIVDICCAFGRHLREFSRLGYRRTVGVDFSSALLRHARQRGLEQGLTLHTARADMRALPFTDVDVALLLFGSFGFFDSDEENQSALTECVRILRPGGRFCLDTFTPHAELMDPAIRTVRTEQATTIQQISYDPVIKRLIRQTRTQYNGWAKPAFTTSSVRLYTQAELIAALVKAGLIIDAQFGGYGGEAATATGERLVVIGHRA